MGERGKALLALIAKPKGKGDEDGMMAEDEGEAGVSEGMRAAVAAVEEIASLLGVDDSKVDALVQALKDFYDNC